MNSLRASEAKGDSGCEPKIVLVCRQACECTGAKNIVGDRVHVMACVEIVELAKAEAKVRAKVVVHTTAQAHGKGRIGDGRQRRDR